MRVRVRLRVRVRGGCWGSHGEGCARPDSNISQVNTRRGTRRPRDGPLGFGGVALTAAVGELLARAWVNTVLLVKILRLFSSGVTYGSSSELKKTINNI